MRRRSEIVSFRAPEDLLRQIDLARKACDLSRGDWARSAITVHLIQSDQQLVLDQLDDIRNQMDRLNDLQNQVKQLEILLGEMQKNLARAVCLVLTNQTLTLGEAKELVRRHLVSGESQS